MSTAVMRVWGKERMRHRYVVVHRKVLPDGSHASNLSRRSFGLEHKAESHIINLMHAIESGYVVPGSVELFQEEPEAT